MLRPCLPGQDGVVWPGQHQAVARAERSPALVSRQPGRVPLPGLHRPGLRGGARARAGAGGPRAVRDCHCHLAWAAWQEGALQLSLLGIHLPPRPRCFAAVLPQNTAAFWSWESLSPLSTWHLPEGIWLLAEQPLSSCHAAVLPYSVTLSPPEALCWIPGAAGGAWYTSSCIQTHTSLFYFNHQSQTFVAIIYSPTKAELSAQLACGRGRLLPGVYGKLLALLLISVPKGQETKLETLTSLDMRGVAHGTLGHLVDLFYYCEPGLLYTNQLNR